MIYSNFENVVSNLYTPAEREKFKSAMMTIEGWDMPSYLKELLSKHGVAVQNIEVQQDSLRDLHPTITISGFLTHDFNTDFNTKESIMRKRYKVEHTPTKVIFNPPATIIFWTDDTKTVVKCGENDEFDPEKGLAMAFAKKKLHTSSSHPSVLTTSLSSDSSEYEAALRSRRANAIQLASDSPSLPMPALESSASAFRTQSTACANSLSERDPLRFFLKKMRPSISRRKSTSDRSFRHSSIQARNPLPHETKAETIISSCSRSSTLGSSSRPFTNVGRQAF